MTEKSKELFYTISKFVKYYHDAFKGLRDEYDLTSTELGLIMIINKYPNVNTANEVANELSVSKSIVSRNIRNLISRGFIRTEKDSDDKRITRLFICREGNMVCHKLERISAELIDQMTYEISSDDMDTALEVMMHMTKVAKNITK